MARFSEQASDWNLSAESLFWSPMCAVVLPRAKGPEWSPRCFAGQLRPEALWNPLLWLPPYLAAPAEDEDLHHWTARVALELSASGVYDQRSGTWLDVSSFVDGGLSPDRAGRWLAGGPDPGLDELDITSLVWDDIDPTWALDKIRVDYGWLTVTSWALWAESLSSELADLIREPAGDLAANLEMLVSISGEWLGGIPEEISPGEGCWWSGRAVDANASDVLEHMKTLRGRLEPWLDSALSEGRPSSWPAGKRQAAGLS